MLAKPTFRFEALRMLYADAWCCLLMPAVSGVLDHKPMFGHLVINVKRRSVSTIHMALAAVHVWQHWDHFGHLGVSRA